MAEISRIEQYLKELSELTTDPNHKRLLAAYKGDKPKESVELELGRLLGDVLINED